MEQNLVAYVNLLENMASFYKLEEIQEVVMIGKTRKTNMPKLIETATAFTFVIGHVF